MATKQGKTRKTRTAVKAAEPRTLWFASLGAFSIARQRGEQLLTRAIDESRTLQTRTRKFATVWVSDARKRLAHTYAPLQARAQEQAEKVAEIVQANADRARSALGIPSKAQVDDLSRRVAALSRQFKAAK